MSKKGGGNVRARGRALPAALAGLDEIARNAWWSWNPDAEELFEQLSPQAWAACRSNPIALLERVEPAVLETRAADRAYTRAVKLVVTRMRNALEGVATRRPFVTRMRNALEGVVARTPARATGADADAAGLAPDRPVAYFCAEYGLHAGLPVYSGGLGILAGDHLKSASDLGVPLVALGLFYRFGYMGQRLSTEGEQLVVDVENDPKLLGLEPVTTAAGEILEIALRLADRDVALRAWRVAVGRVSLYLLDANVSANTPEDRDITRRLYGGDNERRIQQEIVLGRGGMRLLAALGIEPAVFHMNEGHAAFLSIERAAARCQAGGQTFEQVREGLRATTLFTTHTPVPAGHDKFDEELMRRYFGSVPDELGISWDDFFALGRTENTDEGQFNMTALALSFASFCNGVSSLHGGASRQLLAAFWPELAVDDVPITSITNGIHLGTWTHGRIRASLGRKAGSLRGEDFASAAGGLEPARLWTDRCAMKRDLIQHATASIEHAFTARGESSRILERTLGGLDERALLIGFARRFAPYKRAHLLFSDLERLAVLLGDEERPVRVLISGKAHPRDERGREILAATTAQTRSEELLGKVIFLEDYDMALARALVQGVDIWLNNPVRMLEASGTSGMKAAANGGLNLSIGDGWWPEGFDGRNGWLLADGTVSDDADEQDRLDSEALYGLLEDEVVPLFFERDGAGVPQGWMERVAHCLATIPPVFNTDRMVAEYRARAYDPLARR